MHDLHVWPDVEADGSHPSKTPGKTTDPEDKMSCLAKVGSLLPGFFFRIEFTFTMLEQKSPNYKIWPSLALHNTKQKRIRSIYI